MVSYPSRLLLLSIDCDGSLRYRITLFPFRFVSPGTKMSPFPPNALPNRFCQTETFCKTAQLCVIAAARARKLLGNIDDAISYERAESFRGTTLLFNKLFFMCKEASKGTLTFTKNKVNGRVANRRAHPVQKYYDSFVQYCWLGELQASEEPYICCNCAVVALQVSSCRPDGIVYRREQETLFKAAEPIPEPDGQYVAGRAW